MAAFGPLRAGVRGMIKEKKEGCNEKMMSLEERWKVTKRTSRGAEIGQRRRKCWQNYLPFSLTKIRLVPDTTKLFSFYCDIDKMFQMFHTIEFVDRCFFGSDFP